MLNVSVSKQDAHYVVAYISENVENKVIHTAESFIDSIHALGRKIHLNDVHFELPKELLNNFMSYLRIEYPGELYEHKITVA
jgi:hypothetical protein